MSIRKYIGKAVMSTALASGLIVVAGCSHQSRPLVKSEGPSYTISRNTDTNIGETSGREPGIWKTNEVYVDKRFYNPNNGN